MIGGYFAMMMSREFELLFFLLKVAEKKIDSKVFAMFKDGNITIAFLKSEKDLQIIADAIIYSKFEKTIYLLYKQILEYYYRNNKNNLS